MDFGNHTHKGITVSNVVHFTAQYGERRTAIPRWMWELLTERVPTTEGPHPYNPEGCFECAVSDHEYDESESDNPFVKQGVRPIGIQHRRDPS